MTDLMDLASGASRVSGTYSQFAHVLTPSGEKRAQLFDAPTNRTRILCARVADAAPYVIVATGAHADILTAHNERSRLTWERKRAVDAFAKVEDPSTDDEATQEALLADFDKALGAIVKTRATATMDVARTLTLYSIADAEPDAEPDTE